MVNQIRTKKLQNALKFDLSLIARTKNAEHILYFTIFFFILQHLSLIFFSLFCLDVS